MKEKNIEIKDKEEKPIEKHTQDDDWETMDDASFFQFKEIGDSIEGHYIERGESSRYGFGIYTLERIDGERIRFHGTTQLDGIMGGIKYNDYIKITFIDMKKVDMGSMKIFEVKRKNI